MIFGLFGGKSGGSSAGGDDDEDEEVILVSFQGALNGNPVDMKANARLAQAGLEPAKELVTDAITRRAEQVKIELKGERAQVTMYVDGVAYSGGKQSKSQFVAVTQMLKLLSGLDPKLKGQAQEGGVKVDYEGTPYEVTLQSTPQPGGADRIQLRVRNINPKEVKSSLEDFAYPASLKATLREISSKRHGLVMVAGPPGSGNTTLVYAFLKGLDLYMYSTFTMVNMGSREVYNVQKFEKNEGDSDAFTLERIIRSEADVVFLDPIRTEEAAKVAAGVADRVTVLSEMQAKDAASGIVQFAEWLGDRQQVAELLEGFFCQKLIRTLCPSCKEAFRPNPKLLQKMGLPPEVKVLYRKPEPQPDPKTGELPEPCSKCDGVGYYGRIAMVEYILASDEVRKVIASGAPAEKIKAQAKAEGMQTMQKDGLRLVAEGKTSLEELQRVFKG